MQKTYSAVRVQYGSFDGSGQQSIPVPGNKGWVCTVRDGSTWFVCMWKIRVRFDVLQGSFVFQAVLSWERMYVYCLCRKWLLIICTPSTLL